MHSSRLLPKRCWLRISDLAAHQNILEFWRRNCNKREIAEGIRPAPDLPQGPGAINLDACQPHPASCL
jgi:hypothetical protein